MLADILSPLYLGTPQLFALSAVSLAIIILIEATVLRLLRWASWKTAFIHAFIINLVTSLIGTCLVMFANQGRDHDSIALPVLFIATFLATVVIEAVELKVLRLSAPFSRVILSSLIANLFSYLFLAGMIYLALFPPQIGYRHPDHWRWRPTPSVTPAWTSPSQGN